MGKGQVWRTTLNALKPHTQGRSIQGFIRPGAKGMSFGGAWCPLLACQVGAWGEGGGGVKLYNVMSLKQRIENPIDRRVKMTPLRHRTRQHLSSNI